VRSGAASLWLPIGTLFVLIAEGLQIGTGYGRFLAVHIPLAVISTGAVVAQTVQQFGSKR
jgi:hypothetical protein